VINGTVAYHLLEGVADQTNVFLQRRLRQTLFSMEFCDEGTDQVIIYLRDEDVRQVG